MMREFGRHGARWSWKVGLFMSSYRRDDCATRPWSDACSVIVLGLEKHRQQQDMLNVVAAGGWIGLSHPHGEFILLVRMEV